MHGGGGTHSDASVRPPPTAPAPVPNPSNLGQVNPPPPCNWGNGPSNGSQPKQTGAYDGRTRVLFSQDEDETEKHRAGIVLTSNLAFLCDLICFSIFLNQPSSPLPETPRFQQRVRIGAVIPVGGDGGKRGVFSLSVLISCRRCCLVLVLTCGCQGTDKSSDQRFSVLGKNKK